MDRKRNLISLREETFDICVIGAGATGAGVALDAALRGFRVALIEREDFAAETSSKSTKLIHGGVRYLEQAFKNFDFGQLKQVRHGLAERHFVLNNAPHLARPLGIITPVFSWFEGLYFSVGLLMYGWFAQNDTLPKARWLSKPETKARVANISSKIHSSVLYYDGQLDDARYCFALAQSADELGACVVNHIGLTGFEKDTDGKLSAASVYDSVSGTGFKIKSRLFINCTGVHSDVVRLMANTGEITRIRPSKGVHIIIDKKYLQGKEAILIPKTRDGRVVFVIPFEDIVMAGTTDTPTQDIALEPLLESDEVDYLLETIAPFLANVPSRGDVRAGFGGLRPLLAANRKDTKSLLRDHEIEHDDSSGLLSVLGGKWTTYRLMAEDAVNKACRILNKEAGSSTHFYRLTGARDTDFNRNKFISEAKETGLEEEAIQGLLSRYGDRSGDLLKICREIPQLTKRIHPRHSFILAEALYTARSEMAVSLRDFLARRIRMEITDWQDTSDSVEVVAGVMAPALGWDEATKERNIRDYKALLQDFMSRTA